jgi:hypothetical protein
MVVTAESGLGGLQSAVNISLVHSIAVVGVFETQYGGPVGGRGSLSPHAHIDLVRL